VADPYSDLRCAVLIDASEDWTGLYEAWWAANGMFPDLSIGERLVLAERVVHDLVQAGLITLYRGVWDDKLPSRDERTLMPINREELSTVLRTYEVWVPTETTPPVIFATTDRGADEANRCREV
jgi:hypothetical protein